MIREASGADGAALATIYNHYIEHTVVTFEQQPVTAVEMLNRVDKVHSAGYSWLVALEGGRVVGYAYASKWNERAAYRHTVEVSVYLDNTEVSRGWGSKLYEVLFSRLSGQTVHTAIAGIALPNPVSVALHEKFGMTKVAHFKEVGYKFGRWIDVGYWQVQLGSHSPE